jgi:hypothetical protein
MHARLADGKAQLLTRTGLEWSHRYRFTINALQALPVKSAYLDRLEGKWRSRCWRHGDAADAIHSLSMLDRAGGRPLQARAARRAVSSLS